MIVTPEEKKKLVCDLLTLCSLTEKEFDAQLLLHDMLMKDSHGGKLFKYRAINDYSLDCLRNGRLYCAAPDSFNDPFDCKLGITFQSLYKAKYDTELDLFQKVLEKFVSVYYGQMQIEDCSEPEQRIIRALFTNKELMPFLTENHGTELSLKEQNEVIRKNGNVVVSLLKTILSDESLKSSLGICSDFLPMICDKITSDGSINLFVDDNTDLTKLAQSCGISEDLDEIETTFKISDVLYPENCEAVKRTDLIFKTAEKELSEKMNGLFRIGCLATDPKNRLMWSHYADSHKGFCIEYNFGGTDDETMRLLPFPVIYSADRPQFPWKVAIDKSPESLAAATRQMMFALLTKDNAWAYENEWRLIIQNSDDHFVKMPPISCIYLGANISEKDKSYIIEIAADHGIPVKQMIIDRGSYILHTKEI